MSLTAKSTLRSLHERHGRNSTLSLTGDAQLIPNEPLSDRSVLHVSNLDKLRRVFVGGPDVTKENGRVILPGESIEIPDGGMLYGCAETFVKGGRLVPPLFIKVNDVINCWYDFQTDTAYAVVSVLSGSSALVIESKDRGQTWLLSRNLVTSGLGDSPYSAAAMGNGVSLGVGILKMFRSDDYGETWTVSDGLPDGNGDPIPGQINKFAANAEGCALAIVFHDGAHKAYATQDFGVSWAHVRDMDGPVVSLATIRYQGANTIEYAVTYSGGAIYKINAGNANVHQELRAPVVPPDGLRHNNAKVYFLAAPNAYSQTFAVVDNFQTNNFPFVYSAKISAGPLANLETVVDLADVVDGLTVLDSETIAFTSRKKVGVVTLEGDVVNVFPGYEGGTKTPYVLPLPDRLLLFADDGTATYSHTATAQADVDIAIYEV